MLWVALIIVIIFLFISIFVELEPVIRIKNDKLTIVGLYGKSFDLITFTDIRLVNSLPVDISKTWGHNSGSVLRGSFMQNQSYKHCWIYANSTSDPLIKVSISSGDNLVIGYRAPSKTREMYNKLKVIIRENSK